MTSRGGRDRFRRDYLPRSEEKSHYGRNNVPPSRHLWVGNLSHHISENTLADQFLRFGDLERVAFQPGRSYAFVNFKNEEDACEAMRALQGYVVAGNPLRIEFTKADKSSTPSREDDYLKRRDERRDEQRSGGTRRSPFSQRDSRSYRPSPEPHYPDRPKTSDKNAEPPSEVLWIGFPALLKVDEFILRKAFSPFGEIEKITAFPGRSYAFVRFRNVMAACRAKETLQGKLFGNPRVHICFAKSESGSSNSGRNSMNSPPSPRFKSYGRAGSSENFRQDRKFGSLAGDPTMRSPRFISDLESGDPDVVNFGRKGNLWPGMGGDFEQRRFHDFGPELGVPENMYERHSSPKRDRGAHFRDFSPQEFPRKGPIFDDSWDLPEDDLVFHRAKKLKTSNFPLENELPEYPFSGAEQAKHGFPRMFPDFPQPEALDKNFEPGSFGYKQIPDQAMNLTQHYGERSDHWNAQPYGSFQAGSGSMPPNAVEWKKSTPELHQPSLTKEWKWEGTIAKGGTPVCRARCFPVGTVMDMTLPEFLDCTARTSLEMLAKHYYQAANAWVVFFVPESDADIGFYNEFMNYLGEKERAAVAKLDERTTLFVVPPSEFSEKVLKVPGKLSISGVVLRLEHPGSNSGPSLHHPLDKKDTNFMSYHGDPSYPKPISPGSFTNMGNSGVGNLSLQGYLPTAPSPASFSGSSHGIGTTSDATNEGRNNYMLHQRNHPAFAPNSSSHHMQNLNSSARNVASQSGPSVDPSVQGYNNAVMPRAAQETNSGSYSSGIAGIKLPPVSSSMPVAALQPEQLAQLASSLLGQQPRQSMGEDFRHSSTTVNHSENAYRTPQTYGLQNNPVHSDLSSSSQFGQMQQMQPPQQQHQGSNVDVGPRTEFQTGSGASGNQQQLQSGGTQEEDADPQKRLQATLQLAAALLQQIQQGKGN
ncbi:flowering time control protein FPA-like [Camellia sinensis]|uniref:flowering time control protein FPA-like n=1 Tax=Camellia sinensis TaxID=4442 RepID=UPI001035535D|nr:flowering time control protein FPA-like [Camellia sinensis]